MTHLNDVLCADGVLSADDGVGLDLSVGHGLVWGAAANDARYGNGLQPGGAEIGAAGIGVNLGFGRNLTG